MKKIPLILFSAALSLAGWPDPGWSQPKHNIVLIVADDLGWSDLGCYGADLHETPMLDRLASEGVRFTQACAASPVCSPSRASILTGKFPARLHMTIWSEGALNPPKGRRLLPAESLADLPLSEVTLAERLKEAGYLNALVGKWHLGNADAYPEAQGFDINIGGTRWGAPETFFFPYRGDKRFGDGFRYVPHLEFGKDDDYLTDRLTEEAMNVIRRADNQPFFLMLTHHAPHTPIEAKAADVKHFEGKLKPEFRHQNATYAAMIRTLDEGVGRILTLLEARKLASRTVVIFTSDNGGFIGRDKGQKAPVTSNGPLRSGKGSLYEGGVRVPMIIRWPGITPRGQVCEAPVMLTDLFPTLLTAAGLNPVSGTPLDGIDLTPVLQHPETKATSRERLFFHYPHYYETTTPVSSVREGDWKLLHYYEDDHDELFNLATDPYEQSEIASQEPERTRSLRAALDAWKKEVHAVEPTPNPAWKGR